MRITVRIRELTRDRRTKDLLCRYATIEQQRADALLEARYNRNVVLNKVNRIIGWVRHG